MMSTNLTPHAFFGSLDRGFGRAFGDLQEAPRRNGALTPRLDFFETQEAFRLEVDLPGVREEDIHVSIEENTLELRAERPRRELGEGEAARHLERPQTLATRRVRLPVPVNEAGVEATLDNGVLVVTLPKAAEAQPRRIEVRRQN